MNCPVCNVTLVMTERQGVEIDHCPQCRGVWLDRGELDKIIDRAKAWERDRGRDRGDDDDSRDRDDYLRRTRRAGDSYDELTYPPHKRRKSFWEELFD